MGNYGGCDTCGSRESCDCVLRAQLAEAQERIRQLTALEKNEKCPVCGGGKCSNCDIHLSREENDLLKKQVRTLTKERDTARKLGVTEARNAVANNLLLISECDAHKVRAEAAEQRNRELEALVRKLLKSAVPHPTEHPTMWAAWKEAEAALASGEPKPRCGLLNC